MDFNALLNNPMMLPKAQRDMLRRAVGSAYQDAARAHGVQDTLYRDLPPDLKWNDLPDEARQAIGRGLLELLQNIDRRTFGWETHVVDEFIDVEEGKFKAVEVQPTFENPFGGLRRTRVSDGQHALRDGKQMWDTDHSNPMHRLYHDIALSNIGEVCSFLHAMGKTREVEALFDEHGPRGIFRTKNQAHLGNRLDTLADYTADYTN